MDRGARDLDCLKLLQHLQQQAPTQVVRLVGNHELMLLSGDTHSSYHQNNRATLEDIIDLLLTDLHDGSLRAAHSIGNLLFLHAGVTTPYLKESESTLGAHPSAPDISGYVNEQLLELLEQNQCFDQHRAGFCDLYSGRTRATATHLIGKDGPFWVRTRCPEAGSCDSTWSSTLPDSLLQFVGHTNNIDEGIVNQDNKIIYTDMGVYRSQQPLVGYAEIMLECRDASVYDANLSQKCTVASVQWNPHDDTTVMPSKIDVYPLHTE